jgi:hypothetical protein
MDSCYITRRYSPENNILHSDSYEYLNSNETQITETLAYRK